MTVDTSKTSANGKLPKGWRMVRFDEIAQNINDRVDPAETDLEVYVGLEHLDPESLKIRRWGTPDDVIGQKLGFKEGDIIFGKRRAYQRKLAVAECDGICSAHAMVLRAKPEAVDPGFLPFFLQSDMFMERAVDISVGSLSPTINWKTLRAQTFPVPPIGRQQEIAAILAVGNEAIDEYLNVEAAIVTLLDSWTTEFLQRDWPVENLGELLSDVQYGSSSRANVDPAGVPILGIPNVIGGRIDLNECRWIELSEKDRNKYSLCAGDVLIVRTNGNPDYVGRTAVVDKVPGGSVYASYLIRLRTKAERLLPTYLHCALSSSLVRRTLRHEIRSSAGNYNLNTKGIKRQRLPLPPLIEQSRFVNEFNEMNRHLDAVRDHVEQLQELKRRLTSHHVGGDYDVQ